MCVRVCVRVCVCVCDVGTGIGEPALWVYSPRNQLVEPEKLGAGWWTVLSGWLCALTQLIV